MTLGPAANLEEVMCSQPLLGTANLNFVQAASAQGPPFVAAASLEETQAANYRGLRVSAPAVGPARVG